MITVEQHPTRQYLGGHLLWFLCWVGITVACAALHPSAAGHGTHQQLGLPPCPSVVLFNRPCPSCGLTTSFTHTVHGQFAEAWKDHPMGTFLYAAFTVSAWMGLWGFMTKRWINTNSKNFQRSLIAVIVVMVVFGSYRAMTTHVYLHNETTLWSQTQR